jgi:hypothetical protein
LLFRNNFPKCCGAPQQLLCSGEGISMEAQKSRGLLAPGFS